MVLLFLLTCRSKQYIQIMTKKILFVEDDLEVVGSLITKGLQNEGYEVYYMNSLVGLRDTLHAFLPDLLLLDLEIGNRNSAEVLPSIRDMYPSLPILIASSHNNDNEIAYCLRKGANYYIKKPYQIREIVTLIRMFCPDTPSPGIFCIPVGKYALDKQNHTLLGPDKKVITLKPKEFQLLCLLLENAGGITLRTELLERIWQHTEANDSLNNCIACLRNYLKQDPDLEIRTVRGVGYVLLMS